MSLVSKSYELTEDEVKVILFLVADFGGELGHALNLQWRKRKRTPSANMEEFTQVLESIGRKLCPYQPKSR